MPKMEGGKIVKSPSRERGDQEDARLAQASSAQPEQEVSDTTPANSIKVRWPNGPEYSNEFKTSIKQRGSSITPRPLPAMDIDFDNPPSGSKASGKP